MGADGARGQGGYAMAALLVTLSVMAILWSAALPVWSHAAKREKEAELVFRGEQYARAVELFQRKYAGAFPPNLDVLLEQRFLRKAYPDPMTEDGEFRLLYQGAAQAPGVAGQPGVGGQPGVAGQPGLAGQPGQIGQSGRGAQPTQPAGAQFGAGTQSGQGFSSSFGGQTVGPRGGIMGVISKSTENSILLYNGRSRYSEWEFVYMAATAQPGAPAGSATQPGQIPGAPGGRPPGSRLPGIGSQGGMPPGGGFPGGAGGGFPGAPGGGRPPGR